MKYQKVLYIPDEKLDTIKHLLTTEPKDESECFGEDSTISYTVEFETGFDIVIKLCGVQFKEGESNLPWTEAILFNNHGGQEAYTEPCDILEGEWFFETDDGNEYWVDVKPLSQFSAF